MVILGISSVVLFVLDIRRLVPPPVPQDSKSSLGGPARASSALWRVLSEKVWFCMFDSKVLAMRRLMLLISHGNHWWMFDRIPLQKFSALERKFSDRYGVDKTSNQRAYGRRNGRASTHLVSLLDDKNKMVNFWLLATPGEGLIFEMEKMQNALEPSTRLQTFFEDKPEYELVKTPRKGRPAQWTWQMDQSKFVEWHERLRYAIRHQNEDLLSQAIYSLKRIPPFHMTRRQAFSLHRGAKAEWKRSRRGEFPHLDFYVGWVGRFK